MKRSTLVRLAALSAALASCNDERGFDLERMKQQYRLDPYGESTIFSDGRSMREPPEGTVHREQVIARGPETTGIDGDRYVEQLPLPVDRALLDRGLNRFEIFCAVCHGSDGDGRSQVAENMQLRPPPSFYEPRLSELPVGKIFAVISQGYGLMPAYARQLPTRDRWAVTAYVDALRLRSTGTQQEAR